MNPVVPRMNDAQARAWIVLVSIAELLPNTLDAQLTADADITNFEYGIVSMLNVAPHRSLRMGEIAKALDSPPPRLSKAVTRLEKRGLVERGSSPGDGRAVSVHLTRDGRRAWLRATPPHIALARDHLLADYDDARLTELATLLEPFLRRLDPDASLGRLPSAP